MDNYARITTIHSPHDIFVGVHSFSHNKNRWWPAFVADQTLVWILQHFSTNRNYRWQLALVVEHLCWFEFFKMQRIFRSHGLLSFWRIFVCESSSSYSVEHNHSYCGYFPPPFKFVIRILFCKNLEKSVKFILGKKFPVLLSTRFQKQKQW